MKTPVNDNVQIFRTMEGAMTYYVNLRKPARLLTLKEPTGKMDFFVDTTEPVKEQLHVVWPDKYRVVRTKKS